MPAQNRFRLRRSETGSEVAQENIQERGAMPNEKVDRFELEPQMHFRFVIKRRSAVAAIAVAQGPLQDIAEGHVIQMQVVRDRVREPEIVVEDGVAGNG